MTVKLTVNKKVMQKLIASYSPGSDLQKFIDMEIARLSDPYAPSDTAALRKSVFVRSKFGSGRIIYEVYGKADGRNTWNDTKSEFQGRPKRGSFWVVRMLVDGRG